MGRSEVAIIIPVYNESKTILDVIHNVKQYGDVFVIDDCSTDNTQSIVEATNATIISHQTNLGYEAAISSGMKHAVENNYKYIVTTDGDGELTHFEIKNFIHILQQGTMLVVGKRSKKNRLIESLFGLLTTLSFRINDPLCGMKGYQSEIYKKYKCFDSKKMIGTQILAYCLRDKIKIKEITVEVKKREDMSRYGGGFSSFIRILRVIFIFFSIALRREVA